jgi:dUTP pyrophosphatase
MRFFRLGENASLPSRGSADAACYDIASAEDVVLCSGEQHMFSTHVGVEMVQGTSGKLCPRSKLANKFGISVEAGEIDSDYRGEIKVILRNHGEEALQISVGDRIAQLKVQFVIQTDPVWIDNPSETKRGVEGIDSTDERR